jgi:hypothetical protein
MAEVSSQRRRGQLWGMRAVAAAHVAGRMARKNRFLNAATIAAQTTFKSLGRVLHLLWLEVTGLFFVLFAVVGGAAAWREYHKTGIVSPKLEAAVCFSVLFAWFGVSSFWRARRKSHVRQS